MSTSQPLFPPTTGPFTIRRDSPATYIVWNDGVNYHADSMNGNLDYTSVGLTDALPTITSTLAALTAGRTWKEKVVFKGSFNLGGTVQIPAYTELDWTNATVRLNNSVNTAMYAINGSNVIVKGGFHDRNSANNPTGNSSLIQVGGSVIADNMRIEDMTLFNIGNQFAIYNPNSFSPFRSKNHHILRNTVTASPGALADMIEISSIGGEVAGNTVYTDSNLGINVYESDNVQCYGNSVVVGNSSGSGIALSSSLRSSVFGNSVQLGFTNNVGITVLEETDNGASARDQIGGAVYGNEIFGNGVTSTFGLKAFDCSYVKFFGNTVDSCQYGFLFQGGQPLSDNLRIENNEFKSNGSAAILASVIPTNTIIRNNGGYNPAGLMSTPYDNTNNLIGPISGNSGTLTSAKVYKCVETPMDLLYTGGTVSAMTKNGNPMPVGVMMHLEPFDTFSITFTVAPTFQAPWAN
jgi:hypothetical protein